MIVRDASVLAEVLLGTKSGRAIAVRIEGPELGLHVPYLADVEVSQTLRRFVRDGRLDVTAGASALEDLRALDLERHAHEPLDTVLLTCDAGLARAPGLSRRVELKS